MYANNPLAVEKPQKTTETEINLLIPHAEVNHDSKQTFFNKPRHLHMKQSKAMFHWSGASFTNTGTNNEIQSELSEKRRIRNK